MHTWIKVNAEYFAKLQEDVTCKKAAIFFIFSLYTARNITVIVKNVHLEIWRNCVFSPPEYKNGMPFVCTHVRNPQ
jgi:hypothetical protein